MRLKKFFDDLVVKYLPYLIGILLAVTIILFCFGLLVLVGHWIISLF